MRIATFFFQNKCHVILEMCGCDVMKLYYLISISIFLLPTRHTKTCTNKIRCYLGFEIRPDTRISQTEI